MAKIEKETLSLPKKTYTEGDFKKYQEEFRSALSEAQKLDVHPDMVVMRDRKYITLEERTYKGKTFYEPVVKVVMSEDGKEQILCPFDNHMEFLKQYEKWKYRTGNVIFRTANITLNPIRTDYEKENEEFDKRENPRDY